MISVTDGAADKIKNLLEKEGRPGSGLRMAVAGGGCSGLQYRLAFEDAPEETDATVESHGVRIFVDPDSARYLDGVELDYEDGLMGAGFRITNPNAANTCSCGDSFCA
jgi:iron-sulfur cluster assembly accessory protein